MRTHKDLIVWQKSINLVEQIYGLTRKLPKSELFGLISQMQRASVAIPSNIAEGAKRNHKAEYAQFLSIANGSAAELETQLIITKKLYPECDKQCDTLLILTEEILKMIHGLLSSFNK